jgi:hypothetical protein
MDLIECIKPVDKQILLSNILNHFLNKRKAAAVSLSDQFMKAWNLF